MTRNGRLGARFALRGALGGAMAVAACEAVPAEPRTQAPRNECPTFFCAAYGQEGTRPTCSEGRCEAGRPPYDYVLAVSVPTSWVFNGGHTYLLRSVDLRNQRSTPKCPSVSCVALPKLAAWSGSYRVDQGVYEKLEISPRSLGPSVPVRLQLRTMSPDNDGREASAVGLPEENLEATIARDDATAAFVFRVVASPGLYTRIASPLAPLAALPPLFARAALTDRGVTDDIAVDTAALDDVDGAVQVSNLARAAGLDGFRVWLRDERTEDRLSSEHSLFGRLARVRLDTVGQRDGATLRSNVDVVLAPPDSAIGVPTLVNAVINGVGFDQVYPALPPPVSLTGQVLSPVNDARGVRSRIVFESVRLNRVGAEEGVTFLRHRAVVATDAAGFFSVVLPEGSFTVTTEPTRGEPFAQASEVVDVRAGGGALKLRAANTSVIVGSALLADGRVLREAEVLARPSLSQPGRGAALRARAPWLFPREYRTVTDDAGRFAMATDQGLYDFVVVPKPGTGFPQLVVPRRPVPPGRVELDPLVVPAPLKLAFRLVDDQVRAVPGALVRAFAKPVGVDAYVELGSAIARSDGAVELLLPPQPR